MKKEWEKWKYVSPGTCHVQLNKLAETVNKYHAEVNEHREGLLKSAVECGTTLWKAKAYVVHGQFKKWIENNFDGSYPTASVYMRIAKRQKKDPKYARELLDNNITSINAAIELMKVQVPEESKSKSKDKDEASKSRQGLRKLFNDELQDMPLKALEVFEDNFNDFYDGMLIGLSRTVQDKYGKDLDDILLKKIDAKIAEFKERCEKQKPYCRAEFFRRIDRMATMDMKKQKIEHRQVMKARLDRQERMSKKGGKRGRKVKRESEQIKRLVDSAA